MSASTLGNNAMFMLSLWVVACLYLLPAFISARNLHLFKQPTDSNSDKSLSFLVVGDWGRKGTFNQSLVARQMGKIGKELDIDFVVNTGDNFYDDGLTGLNDSAFQESFTNIYTAKSLQVPWYGVLGNHDYRGDAVAQLSPQLKKLDPRWHCERSFILFTKIADFFFVDTTPFVDKYFDEPKNHTYDWRGVLPRDKYISNLLEGLDLALNKSEAQWKIVIGHHAIRSIGHHGDTQEIVRQILPILEAHDVDMYLNGHDHCLERITSPTSKMQFLTSGGGSKAWKNDTHYDQHKENLKFYYDGQGFMSVKLKDDKAKIAFYDVFGNILHDFKLYK